MIKEFALPQGVAAGADRGKPKALIARLVQLFQFPTNSDSVFASNSGLQKK